MLVAQGNLPEALKSFRDSLAIADRLAKADPNNAGWQRDLSVSLSKVGDVLVAQGNLPEALEIVPRQPRDCRPPRQGRSQQRRLAARSLRLLRQSGRCARGARQPAEALKSFRDSLAIEDRLAKADPNNAGWQRDLSVSYNKVGDVLVAQGNLPEALEELPATASRNSETASPKPIPATPDGSAISPSPMTSGRRARGARQPARSLQSLPATASRFETASPKPIPAMPDGSAISPSATR